MVASLNEERFQEMFDQISKMNVKTIKKLVDGRGMYEMISFMIPAKTKALNKRYIKDLFEIQDTRTLILILHLYWEHIINAIIKEEFKHYNEIIDFRFYQKLKILKASNILDNELFGDLICLNEIRNKFVHKLNYDASLIDMSKFSKLKDIYKKKKYKQKNNQRRYNHLLLMAYGQYLLMIYSETFPVIYRLDLEA